jgi:hypothetical protein
MDKETFSEFGGEADREREEILKNLDSLKEPVTDNKGKKANHQPTPIQKIRDVFLQYALLPILFLAFLGGCWYIGEKGKKEREATEAAEKARAVEHANQFKSYAAIHNANIFDPLEHIPGLGELTSDVQANLKSKPVALEIFPDLRETDGKMHLSDAFGVDFVKFDLEISDENLAIIRTAHSQNKMVWVIAEITQSNAKEEPQTDSNGQSTTKLVIRATGKVLDCQIAPK